jgi:hypothetical protein
MDRGHVTLGRTSMASQFARHMAKPARKHLTEAKHALRYLAETQNPSLRLGMVGARQASRGTGAAIYSDADFANCMVTTKVPWPQSMWQHNRQPTR